MSHDQPGIDLDKIRIIQDLLEKYFHDVKPGDYKERFVYNNGQQTSELELQREFIDDLRPEKLQEYVQSTLLPTLRANPGTIIRFGADGISVHERHAS
jgi:hypothetical protein